MVESIVQFRFEKNSEYMLFISNRKKLSNVEIVAFRIKFITYFGKYYSDLIRNFSFIYQEFL